MTMQPLIGITTYGRTEHPAPSTHYETHFAVPTEYVDAVRRAGGVAVLLPPGEAEWSRWLDMCDGVILSGGADVEPRHYGGNAEHPRVEKPDEERDVLELAMTQKLLNQQIPTLFICRGMQVLNIALGGTLHEHVPDVLADDMHRDENGMWAFHEVIAEAGTRVAKAMGADVAVTCSGHHQGLNQVAPGLTVSAVAPDGVVEAVEVADHPFMIGVQWHPEMSALTDPTQQSLFDSLVSAARSVADAS